MRAAGYANPTVAGLLAAATNLGPGIVPHQTGGEPLPGPYGEAHGAPLGPAGEYTATAGEVSGAVGGKGGIGPGASVSEYSARAQELLKTVNEPQQKLTTIDVGPAVDASGKTVTLISATVKIEKSYLKPGEVLVTKEKGHAEIQKIRFAIANHYKVLYVNPSLALCPSCAYQARKAGLTLPGARVSQGSRKPSLLLDTLSDEKLLEMMGAQMKPQYKSHGKVSKQK